MEISHVHNVRLPSAGQACEAREIYFRLQTQHSFFDSKATLTYSKYDLCLLEDLQYVIRLVSWLKHSKKILSL